MAVKAKVPRGVKNIPGKYLLNWRGKYGTRNVLRVDRDSGSISVLTMGLFLVTVLTLFLVTDVASIIVSKRSLVHVTEAAAMSATHQLDLGAYYQGTSNVAIPIDCERALSKVRDELGGWIATPSELKRVELKQVEIIEFSCQGNRVSLTTLSMATLPFRLPGVTTSNVEIHATAAAESDTSS